MVGHKLVVSSSGSALLSAVSAFAAIQVVSKRAYSTTALLTPGYSLGFCAGICVGLQLATGFVLACWYCPSAE